MDETYKRAMEAELQTKMAAAEPEPAAATPSVPYIKYILLDEEKAPERFPPELVKAVYDRELTLSFLDEYKQEWLMKQHMRAENLYMQGRPMMACDHREAIARAVLPAKLMVKLSRSSFPKSPTAVANERILQATQIITKQVATTSAAPEPKRRWSIVGRRKEAEP